MTENPDTLLPGEIKARLCAARLDPDREVWDPVTYPNVSTAAAAVLPRFRQSGAWTFKLWQADEPHSGVTGIRTSAGELLLVDTGGNETAEQAVAALLPGHGYQQFVPDTTTPLAVLREQLPNRVFNMLDRHGFTTVEQIAAVPDLALMDVHNMGTKSMTALRDAIAGTKLAPIDGPVELSDRQIRELANLLAALSSYAQGQGNVALARRADKFLTSLSAGIRT